MPFQGRFVIDGLRLATIDLCTKFEIYVHQLQRYERQQKMEKFGWFGGLWVIQGHQQHNHSIECIQSYSTLIETMHLFCTFLEFLRVICRKWPILTHPICICHPP